MSEGDARRAASGRAQEARRGGPQHAHRRDVLRGERVLLRPLADDDAELLRAVHSTPEVHAWWGEAPEGFPLNDDRDAVRFTILFEDEVAGLIQFGEETEPDYRHAWIDVFVDPRHHGRGLGTDAVRAVVRHLMDDRGHHRVTIDPALDNVVAVRCYTKAGFRRVGVQRSAWRDPRGRWRDVLLMELVRRPG